MLESQKSFNEANLLTNYAGTNDRLSFLCDYVLSTIGNAKWMHAILAKVAKSATSIL